MVGSAQKGTVTGRGREWGRRPGQEAGWYGKAPPLGDVMLALTGSLLDRETPCLEGPTPQLSQVLVW